MFPTQIPSQWSMNVVKLWSLRLNQRFGPFRMLSVKWFSEKVLIRHFCNHVLRNPSFGKYISCQGHLFLKMFKIWCRFEKCTKNWEKVFCFRDKCIWFGCIKFTLLRREYLPLAINLLTNSLKIFHGTKRNSSQLNYIHIH